MRFVLIGQDIGNPGAAGNFNYFNGLFALSGSGEDIQDTADDYYFVHQSLVGDGQIIARVTSVTGINQAAEAGVMIRETLDAGSKHAFLRLDTKTNLLSSVAVLRRVRSVLRNTHDRNESHLAAPYVPGRYVYWLFLSAMVWTGSMSGSRPVKHVESNSRWSGRDGAPIQPDGYRHVRQRHHHRPHAIFARRWPLSAPKVLLGGDGASVAEFNRVGGFKFLVGGPVADQFRSNQPACSAAPFSSLTRS